MRLGLIGLGAIGGEVVATAGRGELPGVELCAVLVRRPRSPSPAVRLVTADAEAFFRQRFDAVLECAGHQAVRDHGERALAGGCDLLVTSAGALTDDALLGSMLSAAERGGSRLIVPSAGIGALDILSGAAEGGLDEVTVTVRKDPLSWKGTSAETRAISTASMALSRSMMVRCGRVRGAIRRTSTSPPRRRSRASASTARAWSSSPILPSPRTSWRYRPVAVSAALRFARM